jgi:hypothetical protein
MSDLAGTTHRRNRADERKGTEGTRHAAHWIRFARQGSVTLGALLRQVHLSQECRVARVRYQALRKRFAVDVFEQKILLQTGAVEPLECGVGFAENRA